MLIPNLPVGSIRPGIYLGRATLEKFIIVRCPGNCGKKRWVPLRARQRRCHSCAARERALTRQETTNNDRRQT